ncbi:MAG: carbamoyltransferase C-terminal domain-containing protein [Myxococcota bacterium]
MYTLGINAAFHDASACLVHDGKVVAAAQEDRFTRRSHARGPAPCPGRLPFHAVDACLAAADITLAQVDQVAYAYNPYAILRELRRQGFVTVPLRGALPVDVATGSPWDPLFLCAVVRASESLVHEAPRHLRARLQGPPPRPGTWHYIPHHLAHAAAAFLPSPFRSAAVMTLGGCGERITTFYALGNATRLHPLGWVGAPHSLVALYQDVTAHLGFAPAADEDCVLALGAHGRPVFLDFFRQHIRLLGDGRYATAPFHPSARLGPARSRGGPLEQRHCDIARSLQLAVEDVVAHLARWLHDVTEEKHLCLAGELALNSALVARLREERLFQEIWVQPAAGDAGTALGAALWMDAVKRCAATRAFQMDHAFLGPAFSDEELADALRWSGAPFRRVDDVAEATAALLAEERVVAFFQGRMELGPHGLGARSVLASPRRAEMRARVDQLKERDDLRPLDAAVLAEEAPRWFAGARTAPFLTARHDVMPDKARLIPAVRHVDGTARVHTVHAQQHGALHGVLQAFLQRTHVPVLVNTTFRVRGEPMVCTPRDALQAFWTSPLDALVLGPFLVEKPWLHG